jgi:hypothetical protein
MRCQFEKKRYDILGVIDFVVEEQVFYVNGVILYIL